MSKFVDLSGAIPGELAPGQERLRQKTIPATITVRPPAEFIATVGDILQSKGLEIGALSPGCWSSNDGAWTYQGAFLASKP